jgi:hypothetical protein
MSWLFSRALVAAYLEANCSDGEPFAPSSTSPMPQAFLSPDKMTDFSRLFQFGMTFAPLMDDRGEALLTWFLADFRAKTSAQLGKAQESTASDPDFGRKCRGLSVKFDRDTSTWKIHHSLFPEDLSESSVTLPKWGLMRDGELWELTTPNLTISEREYGYWPTPQASDSMRARMRVESFKKVQVDGRGGRSYIARVLAVEFGECQTSIFTEWLMMWPTGWTDLKPWGMDKFQQWQQWHGEY